MTTTTRPIKGSSSGAYMQYLQDSERTMNYYSTEDGFDRVWGSLATDFGLERGMSREQWDDAWNGRWKGEALVRKTENRVPMMDFTVSAPKSVSELMVVADEELRAQVKEVMWKAAHEAFQYAERTTLAARVRHKEVDEDGNTVSVQQRYPAKWLATPVMQFCARPTEATVARGAPPDPSLHVHVPVFSLCKVGEKYYTQDNWGLKVNAEHIDSVFMGELTRGLRAIGVDVETNEFDRAKNGKVRFEIKGSQEEARKHWSSNAERVWQIRREYEERYGKPITEVELNKRKYLTRMRKTSDDKDQDSQPVWNLWKTDAEVNGVPLMSLERQHLRRDVVEAKTELRRRLTGPQGWTRDDATFDEATIGQAIRRCAVGLDFEQHELDLLERRIKATGTDLVVVRDSVEPEHRLYTTQTMVDAEARIEREQDRKMDQWVSITGPAGTGKSTAVGAAVEAIRSLEAAPLAERGLNAKQLEAVEAIVRAGAGADQVIVVSTAATTAERTGRKVKADKWGSVESIVQRIEQGSIQTSPQTLLVVEEAGQLDTLRMDKLLGAVGDVRVVSLGDAGQLAAISASGWYTDGLDRHGSVELVEVKRQKDQQDVAAAQALREGRAAEALANLEERGRVHRADDDAARMVSLMEAYQQHRDAGRLAGDVRVVLDGSNLDVDTVNRFVQRDRMHRQEIAQTAVEVDSDDGRRWQLHENDQVIMLATVRVRGEEPVKNGVTGVIQKIDEEKATARIRLHDDDLNQQGYREVNVPVSGAIGLDYAKHVQKFQGGEVPVALVVPGPQTTRNAGYTELTRGTDETHVYVTGSVDDLAQRWSRVEEKESARAALERVRGNQVPTELPVAREQPVELDPVPELEPVPELDPVELPTAAKPRDPFAGQRQRDPFARQQERDPFDRGASDPFEQEKKDRFVEVDPFDQHEPPELSDGFGR